MVEVITPLCVEARAARLRWIEKPHVVQIAFGDDVHSPAELPCLIVSGLFDFPQDVPGAGIVDRMHRVDPQAVKMELANPITYVFQDKSPHGVRAATVKVHCTSPGRAMPVGEVGSEFGEVIAFRSQVVVNDIEDDGQARPMARLDQPLQSPRAAVTVLNGERVNPLIPPTACSGELGHGHQFDGR